MTGHLVARDIRCFDALLATNYETGVMSTASLILPACIGAPGVHNASYV